MLGNVRGRNWCDSPPTVAQNESRHSNRKGDPSSQNCARDGGDERGARFVGVLVFSGCAAAVRLRLADDASRSGALRVCLVHRTRALGAARHTRFGRRRPPGADCCVTGRYENGHRKREQPSAEGQHTLRMQDRRTSVNSGEPAATPHSRSLPRQDATPCSRRQPRYRTKNLNAAAVGDAELMRITRADSQIG